MQIFILSLFGVIINILFGIFWHMPKMWGGKIHMKYLGFDKLSKEEQKSLIEKAKPEMWKTYLIQIIFSFLTWFFTILFISNTLEADGSFKNYYLYIFFIWISFALPLIGSSLLWSNIDKKILWKKFISDILYYLIQYILIIIFASLFL